MAILTSGTSAAIASGNEVELYGGKGRLTINRTSDPSVFINGGNIGGVIYLNQAESVTVSENGYALTGATAAVVAADNRKTILGKSAINKITGDLAADLTINGGSGKIIVRAFNRATGATEDTLLDETIIYPSDFVYPTDVATAQSADLTFAAAASSTSTTAINRYEVEVLGNSICSFQLATS